MKFDNLVDAVLNEFPEIMEIYKNDYDAITLYEPDLSTLTYYMYELRQKVLEESIEIKSNPPVYPFCEMILRQYFIRLVKEYQLTGKENELIKVKKLVDFFERMAMSEDREVQNVLDIGIFETMDADAEAEVIIVNLLKEKSLCFFKKRHTKDAEKRFD